MLLFARAAMRRCATKTQAKKTKRKSEFSYILAVAVLFLVLVLCVFQEIRNFHLKQEFEEHFALAQEAYQNSRYNDATIELSSVAAKQHTVDSVLLLGQCYEALNNAEKALTVYSSYQGKVSDSDKKLVAAELSLRSELMRGYYQDGENMDAADQANRILALDKDNEEARHVLDLVYPADSNAEESDDTNDAESDDDSFDAFEDNPSQESEPVSTVHNYAFICDESSWNLSWSEASAACAQRGGHLATINSQEEYEELVRVGNEFWDSCNYRDFFESNEEYEAACEKAQKDVDDNTFSSFDEAMRKRCYQIFWLGGSRRLDSSNYTWSEEDEENALDTNASWWKENEPSLIDKESHDEEYVTDFFYWPAEGRWVLNDVPEVIDNYYPRRLGYVCEWE